MAEQRSFQERPREHQLEHHDRRFWHGSDKVRDVEQFRNKHECCGDISMMGQFDDGSDTRYIVSDKGKNNDDEHYIRTDHTHRYGQ